MNLYILRHAIALDKQKWNKADSDRPLIEEGANKFKKIAKGLRHLDLEIDWILTSPFRRAYDTAMIAAKELKLKKKVRVIKSLAPDGDPKTLVRHLALNFRSWESVIVVGHDPYLSRLISILVSGSSELSLELDKGSFAKLSADSLTYGQCARLEWLLTPKILKNII
jgi:phosphohistidine phosphatase